MSLSVNSIEQYYQKISLIVINNHTVDCLILRKSFVASLLLIMNIFLNQILLLVKCIENCGFCYDNALEIITAYFYPRQEFAVGYCYHFWRKCPSGGRAGGRASHFGCKAITQILLHLHLWNLVY